jgi:hypothetical protein
MFYLGQPPEPDPLLAQADFQRGAAVPGLKPLSTDCPMGSGPGPGSEKRAGLLVQ